MCMLLLQHLVELLDVFVSIVDIGDLDFSPAEVTGPSDILGHQTLYPCACMRL